MTTTHYCHLWLYCGKGRQTILSFKDTVVVCHYPDRLRCNMQPFAHLGKLNQDRAWCGGDVLTSYRLLIVSVSLSTAKDAPESIWSKAKGEKPAQKGKQWNALPMGKSSMGGCSGEKLGTIRPSKLATGQFLLSFESPSSDPDREVRYGPLTRPGH